MQVPNRYYNGSDYRYGFNGKEKDNEIKGDGNSIDYGFRMYDPRIGRFFSVDPLTKKYPELTPYQFASDSPIANIDLDGLEAYYAASGEFLKWGEIKGNKAPVVLITHAKILGKVEEIQETLTIGGKNLTHLEFEQTAAFAFNETYQQNDIDKFRAANTIVNSFNFYTNYTKGKNFQKALDIQRYNGDSHTDRLNNKTDIPGTETKKYGEYFKTDVTERNKNKTMTTSNAAALNAFSIAGVDYTLSADGLHQATNWLGKNKSSGLSNRFFWRLTPHTGKLNRVLEFMHTEIKKIDEPKKDEPKNDIPLTLPIKL